MLDEQLQAALAVWGLAELPRERLSGDVSPRQYHRVHLRDGATAVAMVTPLDREAQMRDWLGVRAWLSGHGVPVPAVRREHDGSCVLLLEDIGDELLTVVHDPAAADAWYGETLAHLARLERLAADEPPTASPAHARRLEEIRIRWELRRFRKVVAGVARDLDHDELVQWKDGEDRITGALLGAPQVWMHRDLHARNLLVHRGAAVWIDFQDAMRGPWLYDLASLLFDPYAALDEARRERLRQVYLGQPRRVNAHLNAAATQRLWWLAAVQRLVHCVACYVWVADHWGNPAYLPYMPFAVGQLRGALARCDAAAPLAAVLDSRWEAIAQRWCGDGLV